MEIKKTSLHHDFFDGVLEGKNVETATKLYKDAKSFYKNVDDKFSDDTVMYEVYTYHESTDKIGAMNYGLSILKPVLVSEECNMTRGHFHLDTNSDEIYCGLGGNGLLVYMDENSNCFAEIVEKGSIHYIDGKYAHRLINTEDTDLKVGCIWPVQSGHDYKRVEENPFTIRVFKRDNKIIVEE